MLRRRPPSSLVWLAGLVALAVAVAVVSLVVILWQEDRVAKIRAGAATGGDWRRGRQAIARYGCGSCHAIPGIEGAVGQVGPNLAEIGQRAFVAGQYPNRPATMIRWLMHPQHLRPGSGMPEMGVTKRDARDMAAYLYSQE